MPARIAPLAAVFRPKYSPNFPVDSNYTPFPFFIDDFGKSRDVAYRRAVGSAAPPTPGVKWIRIVRPDQLRRKSVTLPPLLYAILRSVMNVVERGLGPKKQEPTLR